MLKALSLNTVYDDVVLKIYFYKVIRIDFTKLIHVYYL